MAEDVTYANAFSAESIIKECADSLPVEDTKESPAPEVVTASTETAEPKEVQEVKEEEFTGDFWDTKDATPKEVARVKAIRKEYTQKAEIAAKAQHYERELSIRANEVAQRDEAIRKALQEPEYYNQMRKMAGLDTTPTQPQHQEFDLTGINTPQEFQRKLQEYVQDVVQRERQTAMQAIEHTKAELRGETANKLAPYLQQTYAARWKTAAEQLTPELGEDFAKVLPKLAEQLPNTHYAQMYDAHKGNELEVLKEAYKGLYEEQWLKHKLAQVQAKNEKAENASTDPSKGKSKPGKAITKPAKARAESWIEEIDSEQGS